MLTRLHCLAAEIEAMRWKAELRWLDRPWQLDRSRVLDQILDLQERIAAELRRHRQVAA